MRVTLKLIFELIHRDISYPCATRKTMMKNTLFHSSSSWEEPHQTNNIRTQGTHRAKPRSLGATSIPRQVGNDNWKSRNP